MQQDNTVLLEGVRLVFRNFTGRPGPYNGEGERSFGVVLPDQMIDGRPLHEVMAADDWNVKQFKEREDEEEGTEREFWLPVKVKFDGRRPPRIVLVTSRGRTPLVEEQVHQLDGADITNVDLIIRPFAWGPNSSGKSGITAYLKSMYVTIEEDYLDKKYGSQDAPAPAEAEA